MPALYFARRRFVLLTFAFLLTAGCATVRDLGETRERPASLEPATVEAAPGRAYDEALTLAFDRGYQILYSDDEDFLIELEALERRLFGSDRVRRIDLLVRSERGATRIHVRVHSFAPDDPGDIEVRDEDRQAARELLDRLVARLDGRVPDEDTPPS